MHDKCNRPARRIQCFIRWNITGAPMTFHPKEMCELFVPISRANPRRRYGLCLCKHAFYFYGASGDVERNRKPTYPLQWETIRWAHRSFTNTICGAFR